MNSGASFTGGAGNDNFDGSLTAAGAQTLGSADVLNGGAGTDTLTAVLNTAVTITPTLTSIETLTIGTATAAATLNLVNSTGYNTLDANGSTGAGVLTFSNISSTAPALRYTSSGNGATYAYTSAAVAGAADSATLTLSDATAGTITIAGVETVNIVSASNPNTIAASGIAAATLNVSGTQNLALGTLSTSTTNLNAGTATGTLGATLGVVVNATITGSQGADTLVVDAATGTVNVSTGLGNDRVTANTGLAATDTLNGGDGADTLVSTVGSVDTTATATAFTNISNFETLEISDALANTVTTARVQTGLSAVTLALAGTGTINFEAGERRLNIQATALATGAVTINDTGIATTDSLTIANTSTTALNVGGGQALNIGGFETTTINSNGVGAATTLTFGAIGITPDTGGSATLNVSGNNSVQMAAVTATSASSLTINASGLTGTAALIQAAAPVRATITTGATNITGSANADTLFAATTGSTVDGGAGNDNINGGAGSDSLVGGLGDDTFTMAGVLTQTDTISGGDGTDTLSVTAATGDASFTNITSVERVTQVGTIALTLGALAAAAGVNRVTLGAVGTVETTNVGSGFTNDLTVVMGTGTADAEVVNATGYTRNLTIQTAATAGFGNNLGTYTGGSGTADRIVYDLTGAGITQAANSGITAIESITTTGSTSNNLSVTLADENIALTRTLTIDGSGLTGGGTLTVVGTAEADGALVVIGGSSGDAITGTASVVGDNLTGGGGADTFTMAGNLTVLDTISGGDGTDVLTVSGTVLDAAFTNVSTVETLTATGATTLGARALAAGITSVTETTTLTVGSGFTAALGVTLVDATTSSVIATGYTGALTVTTANLQPGIVAGTTVTGGSGTSDTLRFNNTGGTITETAANLINVTAIENFTITGSTTNAVSFTLGDVNIAAGRSLTINGSNLTTGVLTVDGSLESNGSLIVVGGGGADQITGTQSTLGDNLAGGAGIDTFFMATANLTSADTISGGDGVDILSMTNAPTITDASFTNITSVETLTNAGANMTVTLGALASASGLATITGVGANVDTITVGAGFTRALTINLATGADNITGSASAAALTIAAAAASIAADDTLIGGTSTGDILSLTADNGTATTTLMAGIETINIVAAAGATIGITMGANDLQIAAGRTLVVNGSALTNAAAALTFTGTASELDGSLSVTGGNGADALTGGGFTDTLIGGLGNDTLTGGLGADVLTGGANADVFTFTAVAQSGGANIDSVTDWTSATDKLAITLDYSTNTSAGIVVNTNRTTTTAVTSFSAAQDSLSGDRGQWVYDTSTSQLYVNANGDNLITSSDYRIGLNAGTTAGNTVVNGDINFVINGGSGADSITGGNGADTISGGAGSNVYFYNTGDAPTGESITGGANTDTLVVTTSTTFVNATFGAAGTVLTSASIDNIVVTSGQTATFTGAQLTGQAINVNATAAGAANLVITASDANGDFSTLTFTVSGGANAFDTGVDTVTINMASTTANRSITGTTLADVINGGTLADIIIGGTGNDSINSGTGDDIVTGGVGLDTINISTGSDTVIFAAASLAALAAGAASTAVADSITGATFGATAGGGDVFNISLSAGQAGLAIATANNVAIAAATTGVVEVIAAAAATTLNAATNVIAMTTTYADSAALLAAIGTGGARLTEATQLTANRDLVIVWSNGTDSYIGLLNDSNADNAAVMATADLTYSNLATLVGVASAATAVNANFNFIT